MGKKRKGEERETCDSVLPTEKEFWSLLRFDDSTMMTFLPLEERGTSGEDGQKMSHWRIAGSSQHLLVNKRTPHFFWREKYILLFVGEFRCFCAAGKLTSSRWKQETL